MRHPVASRSWADIVESSSARQSEVSRKTLQKYAILQIPGMVMVGLLLAAANYAQYVSWPIAAALMIGWVVKDVVMYRFVRQAYEPGPPHGTDALIGQAGVVVEDLSPKGTVRIGAEHWSAKARDEGGSLRSGSSVRVISVEGYTLIVDAADES